MSIEYKKCSKCASNVEEVNRFCGKCGHDFKDNQTQNPYYSENKNNLNMEENILSDNSHNYDNLEKKKLNKMLISFIAILASLILIVVILGTNTKKQKEYDANFSIAILTIYAGAINSVKVCETYSVVWRDAINSRWKDFNDELQDQQREFRNNGTFEKLDNGKKQIDDLMKELSSPPKKYKEAHSKLIELYGIYTQINSLAKSPSGSLVSFNSNINDLQSRFIKTYNELNALVPKEK